MDIQKLLETLSVESAEALVKMVGELKAKIVDLTAKAEIADTLTGDLRAEVQRLADCLGQGETLKFAIDAADVPKLKEMVKALGEQWDAKAAASGQANQSDGDDGDDTTKGAPVNTDRAFSVI